MCALVQVNLNIYLTLKKKLSAIFTILWGKKGTRKVFTEIFPDHPLRGAARDFDSDFFKQSDWFLKAPFSCQTQY